MKRHLVFHIVGVIATLAGTTAAAAQEVGPENGSLVIVGGALLITPGFITDILGFLLLFPVTRKAAAKSLYDKGIIQGWSQQGGFSAGAGFGGAYGSGSRSRVWVYQRHEAGNNSQTIETEAESVQPDRRDGEVIEGEFIPKDRS